MNRSTHVPIKELPDAVRAALAAVDFHQVDIPIDITDTVSPQECAGDGEKPFFIVVDLANSAHEIMWGSWGGANMFNPRNRVDLDGTHRPIPPGQLFIKGHISSRPTWATLYISPADVSRMLPPPPPPLNNREALILGIFVQLNSKGRKEYLLNHHINQSEVDSLVSQGFLTKNKTGAIGVTTLGRNSAPGGYVPLYPREESTLPALR